ncbi:MAG TPA: PhaM family polyhydroxyalkanoate granule multifunctional regulatory protein [Burkholderiaceae bacterium]|jgi:hypothetical protein
MTNPNASSIPGMGAMTDTFDFMKNLWGSMSLPGMKIPGMVMPTLSVEEIDKQIKDLKSVESWLTMNLTMLRGTIQALEVQSATITTIQSMGTSLATAMKPGVKPDTATKEETAKTDRPGKPIFESPFASPAAKKQEEPIEAPAAQADAAPKASAENANTAAPGGDSATLIPPMANPAAWWGMLQDQFKQAVDTAAAMTPEMPAAANKAAEAVKTEKTEKPAKSKTTKGTKSVPAKASAKTAAKSKKG